MKFKFILFLNFLACKDCYTYDGYYLFLTVRTIIGFVNLFLSAALALILHRYASTNNSRQFKRVSFFAENLWYFKWNCS